MNWGAWAWAVWLAVPIGATSLAAMWAWWRTRRAARKAVLDTPASMRAHQSYLDALTLPALSSRRPATSVAPSGSVIVPEAPADPRDAAEAHSAAG